MIGLIAVTGGGRAAAERLAAAWPGQTRMYDGPARQALARAWAQCDGLVCFLAVGATVRLIAPLLNSKWTDPAVVCVDESARRAVAVVGGHAAGANALATRVAEVFGADAVITTATDAVSLPGLDTLGWPTEGAIGTVSRALLDGERVRLESAETWSLPPLPATVGDTGEYRILITDRLAAGDPRTAVLRPPSLVVGGVPGHAGGWLAMRAGADLGPVTDHRRDKRGREGPAGKKKWLCSDAAPETRRRESYPAQRLWTPSGAGRRPPGRAPPERAVWPERRSWWWPSAVPGRERGGGRIRPRGRRPGRLAGPGNASARPAR